MCVQNSSFSHRRSANRSGGWRGPLGGWREAQRGLVPLLGCCPTPSSPSSVRPEVPPGSKMQVLSSLLKAPSLLGCCRARCAAFAVPYAGLGRRRHPDVATAEHPGLKHIFVTSEVLGYGLNILSNTFYSSVGLFLNFIRILPLLSSPI